MRAYAVARDVDLARGQRQPTNRRTAAQRERRAAYGSADPGHQCRRVQRVAIGRTRHPAPAPRDVDPAAIMKWRKPPGSPIDPSPSPGCDPDPIAVAVGRPIIGNLAWKPGRPVIGLRLPVAVLAQVLGAHDIVRNVLGGRLPIEPRRLALLAPAVELIGRSRRHDRVGAIGAEYPALSGGEAHVRCAIQSDLRPTVADRNAGSAAAVDAESILSGLQQCRRGIGPIDFNAAARTQAAHDDIGAAGAELKLHALVSQVCQRQAAVLIEPHRRRAQIQLCARTRIAPERITRGQRLIDRRRAPFRHPRRLQRYRAFDVAQASDATGRIGLRGRR